MKNVRIVMPVVDYSVRALCGCSYHNHRKGCPNLGNKKRPQCPPHGPKIEDLINFKKDI